MPLTPANARAFSEKLIKWYWSFGLYRKESFSLETNDWLRKAYEADEQLGFVVEAEKNPRPAFALWGPSQSGKSTLLSNFLDEKVWEAHAQCDDKVDGTLSGLYWPGSGALPCLFFASLPEDKLPLLEGVVLVNPYNGERDGSAVLSRFTLGKLTPGDGGDHVAFPEYPIQLRFLSEKQILYALAMGYDMECLGRPEGENWIKKEWTQAELLNEMDRFNADNPVPANALPNRQAYEIVYCLCEVLKDLVMAQVARFEKLSLSSRTEAEWLGVVHSLLGQRSVLVSADKAREFAARILWDGAEPITQHYRKLLQMCDKIGSKWGDRTVRCNLKVAALLLDMDSFSALQAGRHPTQKNLALGPGGVPAIPKFCARVEEKDVFLGLDERSELFLEDVLEFGLLQGLVWEMVFPINPANLTPSNFTAFLQKCDLLDFPGVSNEVANRSTQIAAWTAEEIPESLRKNLDNEKKQDFTSHAFFARILKRGKTASIVSTYAKRMTIDGFVLLQSLDKYACPCADQLQAGIHTWWKSMAPNYDRTLGGISPLPLNLVLTYWKGFFDDYLVLQQKNEKFFHTRRSRLDALGRIAKPHVVWSTIALNHYQVSRGLPKDPLPDTPDKIQKFVEDRFQWLLDDYEVLEQFGSNSLRAALRAAFESIEEVEQDLQEFRRWIEQEQIQTDAGLETFRVMLKDYAKGGADFLMQVLCGQLDKLSQQDAFNRLKALSLGRERSAERLEALVLREHMFPPAGCKDSAGEQLKEFETNLKQATRMVSSKGRDVFQPEIVLQRVNHALRELLNVDYRDLEALPTFNDQITADFIRKQYQNWINKQMDRWAANTSQDRDRSPNWQILGANSQFKVQAFLSAMLESLPQEQLQETATWLREKVRVGHSHIMHGRRQNHLPFLAVKMANVLVGAHPLVGTDSKPSSYRVFVEPFLEHQLPALIRAPRVPVEVKVAGTEELRAICQEFQIELPDAGANT